MEHLGHGFRSSSQLRGQISVWDQKCHCENISWTRFYDGDHFSYVQLELMPIPCSTSAEWRKKKGRICFKTAFEKSLWAARMRTYVPDERGHLVILTFQSTSEPIWASERVGFFSSSCWEPCWSFRAQPLKFHSRLDPNFFMSLNKTK